MKKRICILIATPFVVFSLLFATFFSPFYHQYGAYNLNRAVIAFMKQNDGRWPSEWADVEPFHHDPLFGVHSVFFVKRYFDVAWNIDPHRLFTDKKASVDISDPGVPVIYDRDAVPEGKQVHRWILTPAILHYLESIQARNPDA